ncbi:acyltransferase [Rhodococcus sp. ZPP]|uniref:acyltransferase family protein n=1 Tax=Rhodococcus sp. ZPP TaxID=2749906 RepID=UPI001AD86D59|nr:acyltransferase [Rhodococcus sp. ZPP]QTJ66587.1 acyltransferase [Rhodococcus sp. ZPP]
MPLLIPVADSHAAAPRVELTGANLLRFFAVLTVIYSHISFYLIDDLGTGWWFIDVVYQIFIERAGLNQHLSFLGVAVFMMLTGVLITRSAIRHPPGRFLFNRLGRILPAFWVAILAAVVLVRLGINGMFSGQDGISNVDALLSFVLGGFFLKPEVAVLGVTWTLAVQILFYVACVAARPVLRTAPIAMPLAGAAICALILLYNLYVPQPYTVPMLSKIAATLPAVFLGQLIYLGWARLAEPRWIIIAGLAQVNVIHLATDFRVYWAGEHYLWTFAVVTACVVLVGRYDGPAAHWAVVRWTATRSYAIYLVHTLVLYRVYEHTVGHFGATGAIVVFLLVTALISEALYRWVELPASRWVAAHIPDQGEMATSVEETPATARVASSHVLVRRAAGSGNR